MYCPADTADSMFVRWLAAHFNRLGLKRLTATSYAPAQTALFGDDEPHTPPMLLDLTVIPDGTAGRDRLDVDALARIPGNTVRPLDGDGDFRSMECRPYWRRANIVASNPPWSLYRDFMRLVRRHRCLPLVLGPLTGVSYRDILPMLADGRWRVGVSVRSGVRFAVPDSYPRYGTCTGLTADGRPWIEVNGRPVDRAPGRSRMRRLADHRCGRERIRTLRQSSRGDRHPPHAAPARPMGRPHGRARHVPRQVFARTLADHRHP